MSGGAALRMARHRPPLMWKILGRTCPYREELGCTKARCHRDGKLVKIEACAGCQDRMSRRSLAGPAGCVVGVEMEREGRDVPHAGDLVMNYWRGG